MVRTLPLPLKKAMSQALDSQQIDLRMYKEVTRLQSLYLRKSTLSDIHVTRAVVGFINVFLGGVAC